MFITAQKTEHSIVFQQNNRPIMTLEHHGFKLNYDDVVPKITAAITQLRDETHPVTHQESDHVVRYYAGQTCILELDKFVFKSQAARRILCAALNASCNHH